MSNAEIYPDELAHYQECTSSIPDLVGALYGTADNHPYTQCYSVNSPMQLKGLGRLGLQAGYWTTYAQALQGGYQILINDWKKAAVANVYEGKPQPDHKTFTWANDINFDTNLGYFDETSKPRIKVQSDTILASDLGIEADLISRIIGTKRAVGMFENALEKQAYRKLYKQYGIPFPDRSTFFQLFKNLAKEVGITDDALYEIEEIKFDELFAPVRDDFIDLIARHALALDEAYIQAQQHLTKQGVYSQPIQSINAFMVVSRTITTE